MARRRRSRRNEHVTPEDWALVESVLREDFSPEQAAGWLGCYDILAIRYETTYRHIGKDKASGGTLHTPLRCAQRQRRKRYGAHDRRGHGRSSQPWATACQSIHCSTLARARASVGSSVVA